MLVPVFVLVRLNLFCESNCSRVLSKEVPVYLLIPVLWHYKNIRLLHFASVKLGTYFNMQCSPSQVSCVQMCFERVEESEQAQNGICCAPVVTP